MKIILNQDVQDLGEEGDVRDVARGYARNFLFRKGLAVPYNKQNVALFEHKKSEIEKRKEDKRTAAAGLKGRIEGLELEMVMPAGNTGKLFGSVTAASLAEELQKQGISVEKKKIDIPGNTIKMTGNHTFTVRLYEDETAQCSVTIKAEKRGAGKKSPVVSGTEPGKENPKEESVSPIQETETGEEEAVETAVPEEAVETGEVEGETQAEENQPQEGADDDETAEEEED